MPASVILPTRIRVDPVVLTTRRGVVADALAAAAERALISSRDVVLAPRGGYASVRLRPPRITWSGGGLHRVPVAVHTDVEALVRATFSQAAVDAGLYTSQVPSPRPRPCCRPRFGNQPKSIDLCRMAMPT